MRAELWQQKTWGKAPDYTFEDVMTEYLRAKQGTSSYITVVNAVKALRVYFGGMVIQDIRKDQVRAAMRTMAHEKHHAGGYITLRIATFRAAISFCRRELDWPIEDPSRGISMPKREKRVRWITQIEARRLLSAARSISNHGLLADFIELALNTGMRKNEMLMLQWKNVNFEERIITLLADENKSGRTRSIPLNDSAVAALRRRRAFVDMNCQNSPWVMARRDGERAINIYYSFNKACKAAGIDNFRIHDLRHTCASWLVSTGVPLADVKEVLGHASIVMTERYAHLAPHRAIEAVSRLAMSQSSHINAP